MAKQKHNTSNFAEPDTVPVEAATGEAKAEDFPEPVVQEEPKQAIQKSADFDLTNVAVVHDLRKKGILWRAKCPDAKVQCLCVVQSAADAIAELREKFPQSYGLKITATKLDP